MKKNRTGTKKFPALILFLLGFLAGNLIPNIIWKAKWQQKTWASVYFLSTFAGKNTGNIEYLKEILKYRGVFYLLNIICGFWCAACCYNASGIRIVCRYDNDCFYTGIWICRRGDRNGTFAAAIFILHSGLALFYGTGMEDIIRNMEKQRSDFRRSQYLS